MLLTMSCIMKWYEIWQYGYQLNCFEKTNECKKKHFNIGLSSNIQKNRSASSFCNSDSNAL